MEIANEARRAWWGGVWEELAASVRRTRPVRRARACRAVAGLARERFEKELRSTCMRATTAKARRRRKRPGKYFGSRKSRLGWPELCWGIFSGQCKMRPSSCARPKEKRRGKQHVDHVVVAPRGGLVVEVVAHYGCGLVEEVGCVCGGGDGGQDVG